MKGRIICSTFRKLANTVLSPLSTICRWKIAVDGKPSTKHFNVLNQLNYACRLFFPFLFGSLLLPLGKCSVCSLHDDKIYCVSFLLYLLFTRFTLAPSMSASFTFSRTHQYTRISSISCRTRSVRFTSS